MAAIDDGSKFDHIVLADRTGTKCMKDFAPFLALGDAVGDDKILIVTTDRLSAFDVVMNEPIPGKGMVLNQMSDFWFEKLGHIVPNHLTGVAPAKVVGARPTVLFGVPAAVRICPFKPGQGILMSVPVAPPLV